MPSHANEIFLFIVFTWNTRTKWMKNVRMGSKEGGKTKPRHHQAFEPRGLISSSADDTNCWKWRKINICNRAPLQLVSFHLNIVNSRSAGKIFFVSHSCKFFFAEQKNLFHWSLSLKRGCEMAEPEFEEFSAQTLNIKTVPSPYYSWVANNFPPFSSRDSDFFSRENKIDGDNFPRNSQANRCHSGNLKWSKVLNWPEFAFRFLD